MGRAYSSVVLCGSAMSVSPHIDVHPTSLHCMVALVGEGDCVVLLVTQGDFVRIVEAEDPRSVIGSVDPRRSRPFVQLHDVVNWAAAEGIVLTDSCIVNCT